jgi:hypothetical protein
LQNMTANNESAVRASRQQALAAISAPPLARITMTAFHFHDMASKRKLRPPSFFFAAQRQVLSKARPWRSWRIRRKRHWAADPAFCEPLMLTTIARIVFKCMSVLAAAHKTATVAGHYYAGACRIRSTSIFSLEHSLPDHRYAQPQRTSLR